MKQLYIKFEEWNGVSLRQACLEAQKLWYIKNELSNAISFTWYWILLLEEDGTYLTSEFNEEEVKEEWYEEHIFFKRGDKVRVWDEFKSCSYETIFLTYIEWADYPYVAVDEYCIERYNEWKTFSYSYYKSCEIVTEKEKKKLTVEEIEEKLWYWIEIVSDNK